MDRIPDGPAAEPDDPPVSDDATPFEKGVQPLDRLMREQGLDNHALVRLAGGLLTHKMVQKGRSGRRLTPKVQRRLLEAMNQATGRTWAWADLFNYRG